MACFLPFPGPMQCYVQFVPGQNKNFIISLEISAVTSHTAGKNQKNRENILIQFSVMLFGFRVQ